MYLCCLGDCFAEELDFEVAVGGMELEWSWWLVVFAGTDGGVIWGNALTVTDMMCESVLSADSRMIVGWEMLAQ